jgi:hypothetical protein
MKRVVAFVLISCVTALAARTRKPTDAYANVPADKTESLRIRPSEYVDDNRTRNWGKLYEMVSETRRGEVTCEVFISRMEQAHGLTFANYPDPLTFVPVRGDKAGDGGFDLYVSDGCSSGKNRSRSAKSSVRTADSASP